MKPVFQTSFGKGKGNCVTACVASILEVPIESLPEFCGGEGPEWFQRLAKYCEENDLFLLYWKHSAAVPIIAMNAWVIIDMELEGIDYENHAVVGRTRIKERSKLPDGSESWEWETDIVHDPNQYRTPPYKQPAGYVMIGRQSLC